MQHKTFNIIDAKTDSDAGTFTATVAVFGNVDSVGDRILPQAFDRTLAKWRASGDPIPVILSHQHENPMAHIGIADPQEVQVTSKGLMVKGRLDVNDNEVARQTHRLLKRRSLKEFSFGYKVPKGGERRAKDGANDISDIDLIEVGPTLKGANPDTELHAVKSALAKQADEQEPSDDQPMTSQQLRILNSMIGQAQEFIDTKPDDEDVSEMQDVLETLQDLVSEPESDDDSGSGKAAWTTAYVNNLPDSAFLYVAPGGTKDSDGKTTPRSLRYFPVRDANGTVDQAHVRNALSRIPQSNLPQAVKDAATAKAQRLLGGNPKSAVEDVFDEDRHAGKSKAQDPLRARADEVALNHATDVRLRKSPPKVKQPEPELMPLDELKRRMRDTMLTQLSGGISDE